MNNNTKQNIISANLELHSKEAVIYDQIHPELTNCEESGRLDNLLSLVENCAPAEALDIGAGTGFVTQKLLKLGYSLTAIDLSQEMLDVLKQKFSANEKLSVQTIDADSFLASTQNKFALITCSSVLHHLPDYTETIKNMISHLEPNGCLLFFHEPTSHKAGGFENFLRKIDYKLYRIVLLLKNILPKLKFANLNYEMADYHVTHGFDEEKILEILKQEKMNIIKIERYVTAQTWTMRLIFKLFFPASTWSLLAQKFDTPSDTAQ